MRDELYAEMFEMEGRHWWFTGKHRIVKDLLRRYVRPAPDQPAGTRPRVADLGCGCGMMPYQLREAYDVVGLDGSAVAVEFAARRGVRIVQGQLPGPIPPELAPGTFDAVLMLDVLEHLEHDVESAAAAAGLLRPGGALICTVPAYQWLWTKRDEHHQHYRRYYPKQFRRLFARPELRVEVFSFYNSTLFPAAAAARLANKVLRPQDDGMSDLRVPPAPVNAALRGLFAAERWALGRVPLPFGLSLLAVARRV